MLPVRKPFANITVFLTVIDPTAFSCYKSRSCGFIEINYHSLTLENFFAKNSFLPLQSLIKENRTLETRIKILNDAGNLFIKHGFKHTTMDFIAHNLGISKRTIYENFKNKEELVREFLLKIILEHKNSLLHIVNNSENVIEALIQFGQYNRKLFAEFNPSFFDELRRYHAQLFDSTVNDSKVKNQEVSYLILKKGVNEGTFIKEIDIDIANQFIHKIMDHFFKMNKETEVPHTKVWHTIFFPYIKGICTSKGLAILNSVSMAEY